MMIPTAVMAAIAIVMLYLGYKKGGAEHIEGIKIAGNLLLQILPLLIFAFIIAGMIQVMIPADAVSKWIGSESGMRGILIGTVAGGLTPGGPYVSLPIVAGLIKSGAGVATLVAYITSWSIWAIARLPMEVGILGWKFTLIRLASTFFIPPIAGLIAHVLFSGVKNL